MRSSTHLCTALSRVCMLNVTLNASSLRVGRVMNVRRDGDERPAGFYSIQLRGTGKQYSAHELEALAVVNTVQHFSSYLY